MDRKRKGYALAGLSSATFGLAPLFTLALLDAGLSTCEVLVYRWGVAAFVLLFFGALSGAPLRIARGALPTVLLLALLRAATSLSLVVAYRNIASGVASTIHFIYPLAVALAMACLFGEKRQAGVLPAVAASLVGAALLVSGAPAGGGGDTALGLAAAVLSVFFYGGYIVGVRKSRAVQVASTALTCWVMGLGALFFVVGAVATGGLRPVADGEVWLSILGLALPATALSNIALVRAIKRIGPTLTSVFGALEPLTAVLVGCCFLGESFTLSTAAGIALVVAAVVTVVLREERPTP